jgi:hypothetical protein
MFKMNMFILIVLLLSSGAMSVGLGKVFKMAEFIADIYSQLERGCIFLMSSQSRNEGEIELYIISSAGYKFCKLAYIILEGKFLDIPHTTSKPYMGLLQLTGGE